MMAEAGDLIEEFKKAKPPEKTVIILGVITVGGIGIYLWIKNKNGGASASTAATDTTGTSSGQVSGYPTANGVPVLPNGTNPLYDPNGNLVGYQNQQTPGPTGAPGPQGPPGKPGANGQPAHPADWYTNVLGKLGYGATINAGGFDVNGQRFWVGKGKGASLFYAPIGTQINRGGAGRIWIQPPGASGQLLTGPGMQPSKTTIGKLQPRPIIKKAG